MSNLPRISYASVSPSLMVKMEHTTPVPGGTENSIVKVPIRLQTDLAALKQQGYCIQKVDHSIDEYYVSKK